MRPQADVVAYRVFVMMKLYRSGARAFCLVVLSLFTTPAIQAQSYDADAQLRLFASCVGRLSAVVEHEWNAAGAVSGTTAARRDAVVEIVAAILPQDRGRDALYWRNAAKEAQSNLLARANSVQDAADAAWAKSQARRLEQECTALLTL